MNRSNETRLRKLETERAGDAGVVLIAFGPDETAEEATARYFGRRPQDRARLRTICINTGVPRSGGDTNGVARRQIGRDVRFRPGF